MMLGLFIKPASAGLFIKDDKSGAPADDGARVDLCEACDGDSPSFASALFKEFCKFAFPGSYSKAFLYASDDFV
jgi:hypothetical protein